MQFSALLYFTVVLSLASTAALASPTCPNDVHSNVQTTYYYEGTSSTGTTACGTQYNTAYMTAAISTELESAIGGIQNACSRQIVVIDLETGNTVQLAIEDSNATGDLGEYALDITPTTYEALGGNLSGDDPGQRQITWYLVDGVQVSLVSRRLCTNARSICNLMSSDSQLGQVLTQLATTSIQYLNTKLRQANGSIQGTLQQLTSVTVQAFAIQTIIQQAVASIAAAKGIVMEVTAKMIFADGVVPLTMLPDLGKVTYLNLP